VEVAVDMPGTLIWQPAGNCTKASIFVNDLQSGTRYLFRVAAINSAGTSGWSDPTWCRPN
jgi:hypothetical protein